MKAAYFYSNQGIETQDIMWSLLEMGHNVEEYHEGLPIDVTEEDFDTTCNGIVQYIKQGNFDFAISWVFIPAVSEACEECGISYILWIYDCPLRSLFTKQITNSCNYFFVFDRKYTEALQKLGASHCFHLPLGVNTSRVGALIITDEDVQKYTSDISFIGTFYQNREYEVIANESKSETIARQEELYKEIIFDWQTPVMEKVIQPEIIDFFHNVAFTSDAELPFFTKEDAILGYTLPRKFAQLQRKTIIKLLAEQFQVTVYSADKVDEELTNVAAYGVVDYHDVMSKVFFSSKINLNITLPSIKTGIPLRCFDVMGVGGFLLSNYQEELAEYFISGQDLEMYTTIEELKDKCRFYLTHEQERIRIALNGYRKTTAEHNSRRRMEYILQRVFKG